MTFKRLEYLIGHELKCRRKEIGTQTEPVSDQSVTTQTDFGFSPKSPAYKAMEEEYTKPKYFGIPNPGYSKLSDSSDSSDSEDESDINEMICARKRTCPAPLNVNPKRSNIIPAQQVNLEEDLALSSSDSESDSDMEEVAAIIEANIL
jgi:hypothetical protein